MQDDNALMIVGAKGKGGGGSSYRAPFEEQDSLQAIQYVSLLDVISEGPIEGLVDSDKSIYFNETPLRTSGGTLTLNDVSWQINTGTPDQPALPYASGAETEVGVGVEVTHLYPKGEGPDSGKYQFSITNSDDTRLRMTLGVQGLYQQLTDQDHAGDVTGASVSYKITITDANNTTIKSYSRTLKGKTTSQYLWDLSFDLKGTAPWLVTVEKTSDDSTSSTLVNDLYLSSYTEIVGYSFTYPNTAMIAVKASAETFSGSVPGRIYYVKGLKVQVPSNYNPETRAYSGIWDGTFKLAWTDNPAWVLYDMITNDRYGVSKYLPHSYLNANELCDKWYLYRIGQICDELVPDGFGGQEPRYTFNYQIQGAGEAKEVIQSIASVFHGMTYWSSGLIYARADFTDDPVRTITQANVKDGVFSYSSASQQERHSVALVKWNDPDDLGRTHVEAVYDWDAYRRLGYRPIETVAYGCYSRGQAHRHGKWLLASEETPWTVTVEMGLDGFDLVPGDIVKIADPAWMGYRAGGRIKSIIGTTVTLDAEFDTERGEAYQISICDTDGTEETKQIVNVNGAVVTVESAFTKAFAPSAIWSISGSSAAPRQFRVQNIKETGKASIQLTLIEIEPNKFAWIENDLRIEMPPARRPLKEECVPPDNLSVAERTATVNAKLVQKALFSWGYSSANFYVTQYRVCYTDALGDKHYSRWQEDTSFELTNVQTGQWKFAVQARTFDGRTSSWASMNYDMAGTSALSPTNVGNLSLSEWGYMQKDGVHISNVDVSWTAPTGMKPEALEGYDIYYRYNSSSRWQKYVTTEADETEHTIENVLTGRTIQILVKTRSRLGILSSGVSESLAIVGKDAPPAAPTGLAVTPSAENRFMLNLKWNKVTTEPDIAGYRVYLDGSEAIHFTANTNAAVTALGAGEHVVSVHTIDNSQQESTAAAETTVTIPTASPPASVTAEPLPANRLQVRIGWSSVSSSDVAGYRVYSGNEVAVALTKDLFAVCAVSGVGTYTFGVATVLASGVESEVATASVTINLPSAPASVTAQSQPENRLQVKVVWDAVNETDIAGYRVYLDGSLIRQTSELSASVVLSDTGTYLFDVSAITVSSLESASTSYSLTIYPPAAPASISAAASRTDRCTINVTWPAVNESDIAGYRVQFDGVQIAKLTPDLVASTVISESRMYTFRVMAVTTGGLTSTWTSGEEYFSVLPMDVTNFAVEQSALKKSSLIMSWDAVPGNDIDYYEIRLGRDYGEGSLVTRSQGTSVTVENWTDEGEFSFGIKAHCIGGYYSQYPAYYAITISMQPSPPSNLTASQSVADPAIVNVNWWASPDLDVTSYEIRDGLVWEDAALIGTTSGTMLTINCQSSHEYNFLVRANNSAGFASDIVSTFCEAILEPPIVTGFNAVQDGDSVDLWWDKSTSNGVDWYEIREGFNWDSGSVIVTGESTTSYSVPVSFERSYHYMVKAHSRTGFYSDQPAYAELTVTNLSPKNVLVERDYIALLEDGTQTHSNTRWTENPCTWATVGGKWSDYPDRRWLDFGGQYVLSLAEGATNGTWTGAEIDLLRTVKAKLTVDWQTLNVSGAVARLQYRTCNAEQSAAWGPWIDFKEHTETLSKIQFRVVMSTTDATKPPYVTLLHAVIDMPDVVKSGRISVPAAGATINYGFEYAITPTVVATADTATARAVIEGTPGKTSCTVKVLNTSNTAIAGIVNWTAYGY